MKKHKPDIALIRKYLNGELTPREMYELERQAQDDPMLMDVMMGMEQGETGMHRTNLSEISQHIQQRAQQGKTKRIMMWKPWAVAASVVFVLALGGLWVFREQPAEHYIAQQIPKQAETLPLARSEATTEAPTPEKPAASDSPSASVSPSSAPTPPFVAERLAEQETDIHSTRLAALADVADTSVYNLQDALAYQQPNKKLVAMSARSRLDSSGEVQAQALAGRAAAVQDSLTITKEADEHALDEMVVAGYDHRKKAHVTKPTPLVGWKHYNQYLREHARSEGNKKGTITLTFIVDSSGSPTNIRIVKGLSDALNEKAIKLLRDGSKWQMGSDEGQEVNLKIRFR